MKFDGHTDTYGGNLTARSETLDARGNVMRSSTYTDAAMPSSWQVLERPDSIHPALSYSVAGGPVLTVTATAVTNSFAYDGFARRTVVTDGRGNATLTHYNALGQEEYTENAAGNRTTYGYDALGRRTVRIDALGNAVTNAYDALGRYVATSGATYPVTHGFDTAGRIKALGTTRDAAVWDTTSWLYDPATGVVTNKVYADDTTVSLSYDEASRPLRTTWARGAWREHAYNAEGLLAATTYSDATPAVTMAYDDLQRLANASNAVADYTYANDRLGAATNETADIFGESSHTVVRTFDNVHRLASLSAGRAIVHYGYDAENRLAVVSNNGFTVAYAYTSDGWDVGYTVTLTNGTILTRAITRDPHRRHLVAAVTNAVAGTVVSAYRYGYDSLGRVTTRNADAFGYNTRSEVTSAIIAPSHTNRYEYDNIGNNRWTSLNLTTTTYAANALNQYTNILCAIAPPRQDTPLCDLDGNLLANGVWSYVWDGENHLSAAYSNSVCAVSNAYDHAHRRVLKVTPTTTCTYLYDGWNLIQETVQTSQSTVTNWFLWGRDLSGSLQGAGGIGGLLAVSKDGAWYFPLFDNNGNVTAYVDESGSIVAEYAYDAFGRTIDQFGPLDGSFPHRFSTKYFDAETGLYYYGYRFYSPDLMRWLSRDPINEHGLAGTRSGSHMAARRSQQETSETGGDFSVTSAGSANQHRQVAGDNLYMFVLNASLQYVDAIGLMASRLPPKPVMVVVYLTRVDTGANVRTDHMMRVLRKMDPQLKWDLVVGSLPSGTSKGRQPGALYNGACYRHVYYVAATLSSTGGGVFPLGYGNVFDAIVWADRTKLNFDSIDLTGTFDPRISALGRDAAFFQVGGFMLAHEVLHSVGARHQGDVRWVMTRVPTWNWIVRWPVVSQQTVNQVKRKLDVRPR